MEKFDKALDSAKAALEKYYVEYGNRIIIEHLIHAIDLLGDEVAKLHKNEDQDKAKI